MKESHEPRRKQQTWQEVIWSHQTQFELFVPHANQHLCGKITDPVDKKMGGDKASAILEEKMKVFFSLSGYNTRKYENIQ